MRRRSSRKLAGGTVILTLALFVVFIPLSFSDEFIEAAYQLNRRSQPKWLLVAVDGALLLAIFGLGVWAAKRSGNRKVRAPLFALGAALTLALDVLVSEYAGQPNGIPKFFFVVGTLLLYTVSLGLLVAALVDARMRSDEEAESRFSFAWPLLVGTFAAYLGAEFWQIIGEVDQEYFAQVSQVIPLLLIAIGFEARHFDQQLFNIGPNADKRSDSDVGSTAVILTVITLCLGEAMALTALPVSDNTVLNDAGQWHQYAAFIVSLEACFISLTLLIWALIPRPRPDASPDPLPMAAPSTSDSSDVSDSKVPQPDTQNAEDQPPSQLAAVTLVALAVGAIAVTAARKRRSRRLKFDESQHS